ncbi:MAG TPA: ABC transporter substrate-binding protein [Gammaproteobacteria bacterium]|jgi:iron complex transport system substrate-binding protein
MSPRLVPVVLMLASAAAAADELPSVASINLCADQLVLSIADPAQIRTVSWLAADPHESMLDAEARRYPLNYGSAEEIIEFAPDVVVAGIFTSAFTRALLRDLGYTVVDLAPEDSIADIERNIEIVAAALRRAERAAVVIGEMRAHVAALAATRRPELATAVVVRPGGFTVGAHTLADELMNLAGLRNVVAESGLDRWGSLSMETLLRSTPALLIQTGYRREQPSLANLVLEHAALTGLTTTTATVTVPAKYWSCGLPASLYSVEMLQAARRELP